MVFVDCSVCIEDIVYVEGVVECILKGCVFWLFEVDILGGVGGYYKRVFCFFGFVVVYVVGKWEVVGF